MFMSEFWFWRFSQTFLISVSVQSLIISLFVIFKKNHVSVRMNRPSFTIKHICHRPKCFTLVIPCYNFCVTQINKKKFVVGVWKKIVQLFRLCTHTDVVTKTKILTRSWYIDTNKRRTPQSEALRGRARIGSGVRRHGSPSQLFWPGRVDHGSIHQTSSPPRIRSEQHILRRCQRRLKY